MLSSDRRFDIPMRPRSPLRYVVGRKLTSTQPHPIPNLVASDHLSETTTVTMTTVDTLYSNAVIVRKVQKCFDSIVSYGKKEDVHNQNARIVRWQLSLCIRCVVLQLNRWNNSSHSCNFRYFRKRVEHANWVFRLSWEFFIYSWEYVILHIIRWNLVIYAVPMIASIANITIHFFTQLV